MERKPERIAIIGNGGGGKTTLARALSRRFELPLTHVDSIQFLPGLNVRDPAETALMLRKIAAEPSWLIDGFGSLEVMAERFRSADKVIFIDFPLWRHYWWCTKRQLQSLTNARAELPAGCREATLSYTIKLYKTLWRVHTKIRPRLLELFSEPEMQTRVLRVATLTEWNAVHDGKI